MKILHVIETLDPSCGGPSVSAPSLAVAQAKMGHDVSIFSYQFSTGRDAVKHLYDGLDEINFLFHKKKRLLERMTAISAGKSLQTCIEQQDIIHIHGIWRPVLMKAVDTAITKNVKYVIAPRGMLNPVSLKQNPIKKKLAYQLVWKNRINQCSFLHVLNHDEADAIKMLRLKCTSRIIPNGVFPEDFSDLPDRSDVYKIIPSLAKRPYIIFLGRLHYIKGIDYLAQAFHKFTKKNKTIDLLMVGPDGGAERDFKRRLEKLGIEKRVHFAGPLYGREKYSALSGAICFCLTSRQEGFSMAITEAMACGLPVVITEGCHFPEVKESGAGIIVPLDADKIYRALLELTKNDAVLKKTGAAAKDLVFSRFTWPKVAKQITDYYELSLMT